MAGVQAIVVLGAAQYAGRPSPVLKARLDHGIDLWKSGVAPIVVFTGGIGTGDTTSEAAVSGRYAHRHGVPDSAIVLSRFVSGQSRQSRHWVMGMLSTKNHTEMFRSLLQPGDSVYFVPVPGHSAAPLPELVAAAKQVCPDLNSVLVFNDVQLALQAATIAAKQQDLVILCGSLYLLGHFLTQSGLDSVESA